MKYTGLNQLRKDFLDFFESKGHLRLESAPLVPPSGDNSILLINAGMTPLKKYFQGVETPPKNRAASCQKCIRTPDIDNVGITARHGTFFEMLGNFSFGDYFKEDACKWAWEFLTDVLNIPKDLLWISVYEEDDEAMSIWVDNIGIPKNRVKRFGKADNFWEHGSGPCGPCSEIYFDRGIEHGCKDGCEVGCDCDRYIEVWNLVFTQFDSDGNGNYPPLVNKNIDTGMGLERLACVMQGANNLFEVDTIKSVISKIELISGRKYGSETKGDVSVRVITDHVRASSFMIADGVLPSNEGRGYVLRRLIRRAARHGRLIGIEKPFLFELCDKVIAQNKEAYPELFQKQSFIKKTFQMEEESFAKTVEKGMELLNGYIEQGGVIAGDVVFKLHDTFGFPVDLTREILNERGLTFDEDKYKELMKVQKDTARSKQSFKGGWDGVHDSLSGLSNLFVSRALANTKILEICEDKNDDEQMLVILENTPFYAESGGQVGDTGFITGKNGKILVVDTQKTASGLSVCYCEHNPKKEFPLKKGDKVVATINAVNRDSIMRNHTSAHILQSALREVLGEHVHQAGSLVNKARCRFDFTHPQALTDDEIADVEDYVNEIILSNHTVAMDKMSLNKAKQLGATALFGEKYEEKVRVVTIPGVSMELCGGTHVRNTGEIGLFKIISESGVASGIRRIEAVSGMNVLALFEKNKNEFNRDIEKLKSQNSAHVKEISRLNSIIADMQASNSSVEKVGEIDGIALFTQKIHGADANAIRQAGDKLKDSEKSFIAVIAGESNLLCICAPEAVKKGYNAGKIVGKLAAVTGGKGGGRPDTAMAGIGDASKTDDALAELTTCVQLILQQ
ncbi:MAG: alanine--tRNA ligase [Oscillospiraceae bacterium]|nr:alanine--tRNA ligase [Oscillospiraceae bacterium]